MFQLNMLTCQNVLYNFLYNYGFMVLSLTNANHCLLVTFLLAEM